MAHYPFILFHLKNHGSDEFCYPCYAVTTCHKTNSHLRFSRNTHFNPVTVLHFVGAFQPGGFKILNPYIDHRFTFSHLKIMVQTNFVTRVTLLRPATKPTATCVLAVTPILIRSLFYTLLGHSNREGFKILNPYIAHPFTLSHLKNHGSDEFCYACYDCYDLQQSQQPPAF